MMLTDGLMVLALGLAAVIGLIGFVAGDTHLGVWAVIVLVLGTPVALVTHRIVVKARAEGKSPYRF
jgi:hypothetical protein